MNLQMVVFLTPLVTYMRMKCSWSGVVIRNYGYIPVSLVTNFGGIGIIFVIWFCETLTCTYTHIHIACLHYNQCVIIKLDRREIHASLLLQCNIVQCKHKHWFRSTIQFTTTMSLHGKCTYIRSPCKCTICVWYQILRKQSLFSHYPTPMNKTTLVW